jgi:hypothetical protein
MGGDRRTKRQLSGFEAGESKRVEATGGAGVERRERNPRVLTETLHRRASDELFRSSKGLLNAAPISPFKGAVCIRERQGDRRRDPGFVRLRIPLPRIGRHVGPCRSPGVMIVQRRAVACPAKDQLPHDNEPRAHKQRRCQRGDEAAPRRSYRSGKSGRAKRMHGKGCQRRAQGLEPTKHVGRGGRALGRVWMHELVHERRKVDGDVRRHNGE